MNGSYLKDTLWWRKYIERARFMQFPNFSIGVLSWHFSLPWFNRVRDNRITFRVLPNDKGMDSTYVAARTGKC